MIFSANEDKSYLNNSDKRIHRGKLINFESCGNFQNILDLLTKYFDSIGKSWIYLTLDNSDFEVVLKEQFEERDPLFIANNSGMNRYCSKAKIVSYLDLYDYIIVNNYTIYNMATQAAKYDDEEKKQGIIKWIDDFEFKFLQIPYPDFIFYIDIPINIIHDNNELIKQKRLQELSEERKMYLGLIDLKNYHIIKTTNIHGIISDNDILNELINLFTNI